MRLGWMIVMLGLWGPGDVFAGSEGETVTVPREAKTLVEKEISRLSPSARVVGVECTPAECIIQVKSGPEEDWDEHSLSIQWVFSPDVRDTLVQLLSKTVERDGATWMVEGIEIDRQLVKYVLVGPAQEEREMAFIRGAVGPPWFQPTGEFDPTLAAGVVALMGEVVTTSPWKPVLGLQTTSKNVARVTSDFRSHPRASPYWGLSLAGLLLLVVTGSVGLDLSLRDDP